MIKTNEYLITDIINEYLIIQINVITIPPNSTSEIPNTKITILQLDSSTHNTLNETCEYHYLVTCISCVLLSRYDTYVMCKS